ncbi:MAG: hypothetical protein L0Z53_25450 [Acidobacteriales bacterium]|nr:hypothetical protein [Terriglobales bacterium]
MKKPGETSITYRIPDPEHKRLTIAAAKAETKLQPLLHRLAMEWLTQQEAESTPESGGAGEHKKNVTNNADSILNPGTIQSLMDATPTVRMEFAQCAQQLVENLKEGGPEEAASIKLALSNSFNAMRLQKRLRDLSKPKSKRRAG